MYKLSKIEREQYGSIILLNSMINLQMYYPIILTGNQTNLEPLLKLLHKNDMVRIENNTKYVPTEKGRTHLLSFYKKYWEFLRMFDLYCAVDLNAGTFAFSEFYNMEDEEWSKYLNQENWEDVRVAVCEFKKINPLEVTFMSFINECRFDLEIEGWEFDLVSGLIWDQIEHVCNNSLSVKDLEDNNTEVKVLVEMGTKLMFELLEQEKNLEEEESESAQECDDEDYEEEEYEEVVEYVEIIEEDVYYDDVYFDPYWDPFYVSPYWSTPILYVGYY